MLKSSRYALFLDAFPMSRPGAPLQLQIRRERLELGDLGGVADGGVELGTVLGGRRPHARVVDSAAAAPPCLDRVDDYCGEDPLLTDLPRSSSLPVATYP